MQRPHYFLSSCCVRSLSHAISSPSSFLPPFPGLQTGSTSSISPEASTLHPCGFSCLTDLCLNFPPSSAWAPAPVIPGDSQPDANQHRMTHKRRSLRRHFASLASFASTTFKLIYLRAHGYLNYPFATASERGTGILHSRL